jgi:aerobic carbon-monoxide dehydrogenase medium subunit
VIPADFEYLRATSVDHALQLLADHGDEAKLLCGGHSLLPLMKLRLARPSALIDIRTLPELNGIRADGDMLVLGAATRHRQLELDPIVARMAPLLAKAAATIGDPQVRSRGTIGGSIVHADPAADLPATLLALEAVVTVRGPDGRREIPIAEFFLDFWQTAVQPNEVLTEIAITNSQGRPTSFQKFTQRAQDWAIVGVAAIGGDLPRIALVNMALTPVRALAVEKALSGGADIVEAARHADEGTSPSSDLRADAAYRRHLARTLTHRALAEIAA